MRPPTAPQVRRIIVRLHKEGRTYEEIADLVGVGRATVSRILRLHRETGALEPAAPGGGNWSPIRGKIEEKLRELVTALPDSTIAELGQALSKAEKLATSRASVHRALARMGFSRKKRAASR